MSPRFLPLLNFGGCLVLAVIIVIQWRREQTTEDQLHKARATAALRDQQLAAETRRADGLAHDVGLLKKAVESQQQAIEQAQANFAHRDTQASALQEEVTRRQAELAAAAGRVAEWEHSVAARDQRISELEAALKEARARLDEAVAKLRQAGAR